MTDNPIKTSTLRKHPEIAEQIGYLMEHYAGLEYFMFVLYVTISTLLQDEVDRDDIDGCFAEFYRLRTANLKSGLVLTAAKPLLDEPLYRACVRVWRRFKGAAGRRTDVAHCVFMSYDKPGIYRLSAAKPIPTFEPFALSFFDRTSDQFRILGIDILTLVSCLVGTEKKLASILRALPVPPSMPLPPEDVAHQALPNQYAKGEREASLSRLGLRFS
jgi:hypothetical protein